MNTLRTGQSDALHKFEKHFYEEENDKGILSACCGFGKTRLCYELIKKCRNKGETKFIIATSRVKLLSDLMTQIQRWFKIEEIKANIYRVGGSSDIVGITSKKVKELKDKKDIYLHFKSATSKSIVIIISTYNSGKKILDGLKDKEDAQPDLIIFDEAHNTTGKKGKFHQDLMKLTSEKKIFMTATPLNLLFKNKDNIGGKYLGEIVNSMGNEDTYGKIFYEYTFKDGTNDKIIVDFKCITLGKNQYMKKCMILKRK